MLLPQIPIYALHRVTVQRICPHKHSSFYCILGGFKQSYWFLYSINIAGRPNLYAFYFTILGRGNFPQSGRVSIPKIQSGKRDTISLHYICLNIPTIIILPNITFVHSLNLIIAPEGFTNGLTSVHGSPISTSSGNFSHPILDHFTQSCARSFVCPVRCGAKRLWPCC